MSILKQASAENGYLWTRTPNRTGHNNIPIAWMILWQIGILKRIIPLTSVESDRASLVLWQREPKILAWAWDYDCCAVLKCSYDPAASNNKHFGKDKDKRAWNGFGFFWSSLQILLVFLFLGVTIMLGWALLDWFLPKTGSFLDKLSMGLMLLGFLHYVG